MNRRETFLTIGSALAMASTAAVASARTGSAPARDSQPDYGKDDVFRIWPGRAPFAASDRPEETPTLRIYRPPVPWRNGGAVVIAPGGAYAGLASVLEGEEPAAWMVGRSVTAFVLTYRVGATALLPVPLLDGARAVRFVRAHAAEFGVDPGRIGMMGFSAGGHLAAMTAEETRLPKVSVADEVERFSARPDYLILGYPWLEATDMPSAGGWSYCEIVRNLTHEPCQASKYAAYSPLAGVSARVPPTFIYHTSDDNVAPIGGSIRFFSELHRHGVPVEFHSFVSGQHGSGLGGCDPSLSQWPVLLQEWMRRMGLLPPASRR